MAAGFADVTRNRLGEGAEGCKVSLRRDKLSSDTDEAHPVQKKQSAERVCLALRSRLGGLNRERHLCLSK